MTTPIAVQPKIHISPEKKASKPPAGAALYDDIFLTYTVLEQIFLAGCAPRSYGAGALLGLAKGLKDHYDYGAPKKIDQDSEKTDFAAAVHSEGLTGFFRIIGKKFFLGTLLPTHLGPASSTLSGRDFKPIDSISTLIRCGFVFKKSAEFSNSWVQRYANWNDIPAK